MINLNAISFDVDAEGFLLDTASWNNTIAEQLAQQDGLVLSEDHWTVIQQLRDFYHTFHRHPTLRILIKALSSIWTPEKTNSLYLHQLFPENVLRKASKIAGLPKPRKCMSV